MRITVANKPVKGDKPRTKLESKTYFNNLQFHSETISPEKSSATEVTSAETVSDAELFSDSTTASWE